MTQGRPIPVRVEETGQVFDTMKAAAAYFKVSPDKIRRSLDAETPVRGYMLSVFSAEIVLLE